MTGTSIPQGSTANIQGTILDQTIIPTFSHRGFEVLPHRIWTKNPSLHSSEVLLKNVPYTTIYNHPGRTEFLLKSTRYNLNIRIEFDILPALKG